MATYPSLRLAACLPCSFPPPFPLLLPPPSCTSKSATCCSCYLVELQCGWGCGGSLTSKLCVCFPSTLYWFPNNQKIVVPLYNVDGWTKGSSYLLPDFSLKHCDLDAVPVWEFFRICSSQIYPQVGSQSYLTFTDWFRTQPLPGGITQLLPWEFCV